MLGQVTAITVVAAPAAQGGSKSGSQEGDGSGGGSGEDVASNSSSSTGDTGHGSEAALVLEEYIAD